MIKPLTSLRFFFAWFVFTSHISFVSTDSEIYNWLQRNVFFEGYLGVSFFFILSGFVLAHSYKKKIETQTVSKRKFWIARFARIYPLHFLTLIIITPYILVTSGFSVIKFITNLFLIQSFIPIQDFFYSFNSPSWSISDEMFFYLLFPFYIIIFNKYTWIKYLFPCIILFFFYIIPVSHHKFFFYINPVLRSFDFILGILLCFSFHNQRFKKLFNTYLLASIVEFSCIILFLVFFIFHNFIHRSLRFSIYYWIPMCFIIYTFAYQKGIISKILSNKWLVLLGEISFAFYMFHYVVILYTVWIKEIYFKNISDFIVVIFIFTLTLIISYLSFMYYEKPLNKWIKNKLDKKNDS